MKHGLETETLILVPEQKRELSPNYTNSDGRTKSETTYKLYQSREELESIPSSAGSCA